MTKFFFDSNATYRCSKREVAAVDSNIIMIIAVQTITASPAHVQPVTAALSDKVVNPESDVVANGHYKKALMVQPVGVLNAVAVLSVVVYRIRVSRISGTKSPGAHAIGSFSTSATCVRCPPITRSTASTIEGTGGTPSLHVDTVRAPSTVVGCSC